MSRVCPSDGSFGPGIGLCRGGFDFTLVFEDSILSILPQAALLLLAPVRLATLRRRRHRVAKNSHLGFLKTVTSSCYAISSVILLVIWCRIEQYKTKLSIASAALEFLGSIAIVALSRYEHSRAVRPSHLLQFFLLILLLCDAVRLRTLFLMDYSTNLVTPASIHTFLTGLLLLLESLDKKDLFISDRDRTLPPGEYIGLFGKRLFWYLNGLFKEGYKKVLKPGDLFNIDADLASKQRAVSFQQVWEKLNKSNNTPLIRTIVKVLWLDLFSPVIPRLIQMATTLSQPYLITAMVKFTGSRAETMNFGYGLIAAFALNYSILAIASSWYQQCVARFSTKLRGCLIALIYERTLQISSKEVNVGAATVLMNVDVEKVQNGVRQMHEVWATFVSMSVALYILYSHLGVSFVAPFITTLIATGTSAWIGRYMRPRQMNWVAATQRRVTTIAYVVGCMKGVRMLGLSETVQSVLESLRKQEVAARDLVQRLLIWIVTISNVIFQLTTLATYVTFAVIALLKTDRLSLDYQMLYGSLSALKLVTSPLMIVIQLIPSLQGALVSLERIETFVRGDVIKQQTEYATAPEGSVLRESEHSDGIELLPSRISKGEAEQSTSSIIRLKDAAFGVGEERSILSDLTLNVKRASVTMVFGKVGSGKSVFLRSLVGETVLLGGSFVPPSTGTAYCDQAVWLRNGTVRENIVAESDFDSNWYNTVVWSCGLNQDLQSMKKGDLTPIGSKGISLSGGQKNRISLARALYARKPVMIIDDMLAGLDNKTERLVFDRVFGPGGLLRKSDTTVILATHATYYARHADDILILSEGRVIEHGLYLQLLKKGTKLHALQEASRDVPTGDSDAIEESVNTELAKPLFPTSEPVDEDECEEDASRRSGDRQSLFYLLSAVGPLHCGLYFGLLTLATAATTIQFLWLKWWAESKPELAIRNFYLFIGITVLNVLIYLVYIGHFGLFFQPVMSLALHSRQLVALMRAKFSYLVSTDIGNITNRFSQDIVLVDIQLQNAWINVTDALFNLIAQIGILVVATPPVAATIPLLGGVGYVVQRIYLRTSRQVRLMDLEAKAPLCTHFLESLAGISTIRAFGWSDLYRRKNEEYLLQSQIPLYLLFEIQNWLTLTLELMIAGLVTVLVALAVGLRSRVDPGYLGLALVAAMDLGFIFRILITAWTEMETSLGAIARIRQFAQTPSEPHDDSRSKLAESWPAHGSVHFKDLVASYSDNGKAVLHGVNLKIGGGEKIGLCGRTGSGKSSLVATLFGLLHEQGGQILIDGVPTTDISLSVLRSKMVALPQEAFFLRGTVRYNLAPWTSEPSRRVVSDAQMRDALEQVELWGKLSDMAEGNDTALDVSLDDVDSLLSQGEKQLFCLARAMLMDGKIVVLDEATSSVDAQTDELMQRILRTAFADRTIIAIAHRLDTILDFDRVVVMDAGQIVEIGEPSVLMRTDGSLFRGLVESQAQK